MGAIDIVERRDSDPHAHSSQFDDGSAQREAAYEHHINAACAAIQKTPFSLVTPAFIGQVLDTLACKAQEAHLVEECGLIEILACEVTP